MIGSNSPSTLFRDKGGRHNKPRLSPIETIVTKNDQYLSAIWLDEKLGFLQQKPIWESLMTARQYSSKPACLPKSVLRRIATSTTAKTTARTHARKGERLSAQTLELRASRASPGRDYNIPQRGRAEPVPSVCKSRAPTTANYLFYLPSRWNKHPLQVPAAPKESCIVTASSFTVVIFIPYESRFIANPLSESLYEAARTHTAKEQVLI